MWRKIETAAGVDHYEKRLKFGLDNLWLTAGPDRWQVASECGTRFIHGQADSFETAREQAVAATLTMLRDARRRLEQEIVGADCEPV